MTVASIMTMIIGGIITNNIIFSQAIGICPFLGVSKKTSSSIGMGLAVTFVLCVSSIVCYLLFQFVLVPLNMVYLQTIVFILIIAALVQLLDIILKKISPTLYKALGVYLALITTNCCVLYIANASVGLTNILEVFVSGLSTGLGFTLALLIMAGVRERLATSLIPKPLQGLPIVLIAAGLMAMAFIGFGGLVFFS